MKNQPLLEVKNLSKYFYNRLGFFKKKRIDAVCDVSFTLNKGETLCILGQEHSGKSTLVKMVAGIIKQNSGNVVLNGEEITFGNYAIVGKEIRFMFQGVDSSFDPQKNVIETLDIALKIATSLDKNARFKRIIETLNYFDIFEKYYDIPIGALVKNDKYLIYLARAIIVDPSIVIVDDIFIDSDAAIRTKIINFILKIQKEKQISFIFVGNDIGVAKHISDYILFLENGKISDYGATKELLNNPQSESLASIVKEYLGEYSLSDLY